MHVYRGLRRARFAAPPAPARLEEPSQIVEIEGRRLLFVPIAESCWPGCRCCDLLSRSLRALPLVFPATPRRTTTPLTSWLGANCAINLPLVDVQCACDKPARCSAAAAGRHEAATPRPTPKRQTGAKSAESRSTSAKPNMHVRHYLHRPFTRHAQPFRPGSGCRY